MPVFACMEYPPPLTISFHLGCFHALHLNTDMLRQDTSSDAVLCAVLLSPPPFARLVYNRSVCWLCIWKKMLKPDWHFNAVSALKTTPTQASVGIRTILSGSHLAVTESSAFPPSPLLPP